MPSTRPSAGTLGAWYKAALTRNAAAVLMRATAGSSGLRLGAFVVRKQSDNVRIHVLSTYQPTRRSGAAVAACFQHIRIHVSWLLLRCCCCCECFSVSWY